MRKNRFTTTILTPLYPCDLLLALAIVAGVIVASGEGLAKASGLPTMRSSSPHDAFLTAIVLALEVALFIAVPLYWRARQRSARRARIRVHYDSRRNSIAKIRALPMRERCMPAVNLTNARTRVRAPSVRVSH